MTQIAADPPLASSRRKATDWVTFACLLSFALLHGLLYLFLILPWQGYDEPTHFEHALIRAASDLATYRNEFVQPIADSMQRFDFWGPDGEPTYRSPGVPFIGFNQRIHPPFYYELASLPIEQTLDQSIETQLYAARLLSLALYVVSVLAVWRLAVVLTPDQPSLQVAVPLIYATLPAFASLMVTVNNDVLINATGAMLLLACALLIRDGLRPLPLLMALLSLGIGVAAKRTAVLGVVPLVLALFWSLKRQPIRGIWRWVTLVLGLALATGGFVAAVEIAQTEAGMTFELRPWFLQLDQQYLRLRLEPFFLSIMDWENSAQLYPFTLEVAFRTHWGAYGWDRIVLDGVWTIIFLLLSAAAGLGLLIRAFRRRDEVALWQRRVIWMLLSLIAVGVAALLLRVHPIPPYGDYVYISRGRYLFGMLGATIWLLVFGLLGLLPRRFDTLLLLALVLFFFIFNTYGLVTLITEYYGQPWTLEALTAGKPWLFAVPALYLALGVLTAVSAGVCLWRVWAVARVST
ncbi:glycosyltransferase family 39 protein [Candidatus Chloroploca sp. M-50]|uniref:Glycosyltransferase family 39 protein n=1 Tax=Candidatus Chloroploca mongolica TaxID=2528176 RepID=A0ABS4DBA5_9CHLR|nr:glycosyltransferase family 39 protein [Candidatus Chloroploca mongolica]MBP1466559.1 glycosyltransferase family 39 protein [Candidatus Chloroploca mongolica]